MKKNKILLGLIGAMVIFASCSTGPEESPKVKYYNPRKTENVLFDHEPPNSNPWTPIATIAPESEAEIEMDEEKAKHTWFTITEGSNWMACLWDTVPYYLDITDVEFGKEYICLNTSNISTELIDNGYGYYNMAFYKVMDEPDGSLTFEYPVNGEKKYIRRWPDLSAWVNDEDFVKANLGKIVVAREDYFDGYEMDQWDYARGWRTEINGTLYSHFINQYGFTKK